MINCALRNLNWLAPSCAPEIETVGLPYVWAFPIWRGISLRILSDLHRRINLPAAYYGHYGMSYSQASQHIDIENEYFFVSLL